MKDNTLTEEVAFSEIADQKSAEYMISMRITQYRR